MGIKSKQIFSITFKEIIKIKLLKFSQIKVVFNKNLLKILI